MSDNFGHLTKPQREALEALAKGATKEQAAAVAGRTRRTLDRWMHDPDFLAAVNQLTGEAVDDAGRRLAGLMGEVVSAAYYVLKHPETPAHTRIRAGDSMTNNMIRLQQHRGLEKRLESLEELINELRKQNKPT